MLGLKFLIVIHLFYKYLSNQISLEITSTNSIINQLSTYTFRFARDTNPLTYDFITPTQIPLNSVVSIVFPIQYTTNPNDKYLACFNTDTDVALTCRMTGWNKTLSIFGFYSNIQALTNLNPRITVKYLLNPYKSGQSSNFQYSIIQPNGTVIDKSPSVTNGIYSTYTSTPGQFSSCKISASGSTILTRSQLTIFLTPSNPIPSSGTIVLSFPLFWSNDLVSSPTLTSFLYCVPLSNVSATITCSFSIVNAPVNMVYLTISWFTTTTLASSFSFMVGPILTPPYVNPSNYVAISSQWADGTQIDTCQTTVTDLVPIQFQALSFGSTDNKTVLSGFNGLLSVTLAVPFVYTDTITLSMPLEFMGATISSTAFGFFSQNNDVPNQVIKLYNFPATSSKPASAVLNFSLAGLINPNSIKPVSLRISFYRSGSLYQQQSVSYRALTGPLGLFSLAPFNLIVNSNGFVKAQIIAPFSIPASSIILILYPSTVTASSTTSCVVTSALLNGTSINQVTMSVQNNVIKIQNLFQSNFVGDIISLTFSPFKNPPTVQSSQYSFIVQTFDGFNIYYGTTIIVPILKGLVSSQITASSYQVLAYPTTLTVTVELNYQATSIQVIVPADILIKNGFQTTITPNTIANCLFNGSNLVFQGNFQPGIQTISWGNNQNPNSLQPTLPFTIFTYYRGFGVERSIGYLNLQMFETNKFSKILINPSSTKNNQIISVTMIIKFPTNGIKLGNLIIIFPDVLDISNIACSINCAVMSNNVTLSLSSNINLSVLVITFNYIKNAISFQTIAPFTISFISLQNDTFYPSLAMSCPSWTNSILSTFTCVVSTTSSYLSSLVLFKFKLSSLTGKETYVTIRFNDLFGELTANPTGGQLIDGRLVMFNIENSVNKQIYLQLLTPPIFGDYTFTLLTYQTVNNGSSYLVGQSTSNVWHHSCFGTVCKTCYVNNNSQCLSCYDISVSVYYIFDATLQTCTRSCNSGFYLTNLNICGRCSSNCMQCNNSFTNCTSCYPGQSLFLDLTYKKCVRTCTPGQYGNTQIQQCLSCSPICLTCSESPSHCLTCPISTFLINFDCLSSCPATNQYISNVLTRTCDLCVGNCVTCLGQVTNCTSCNGSLGLYLENGKCVGVCQANNFISVTQGKCALCMAPCNTCSSYDKCATCLAATATFWFSNACISASSCPIGYFINTANASCDKCQNQCSQCSSLNLCSSCKTGFSLYQSQCVSSCPNTTLEISQICVACNGCFTCSNSLANCTSCVGSQFLYLEACYLVCPATTFKNATLHSCIDCPSYCPSCVNSTYCTSCLSLLYMLNGACLATCPSSTFPTTYLPLNCIFCPSQCLTCTSLTSCLTCSPTFNLQNTQCVTTCSKGIAYNQICYPCGLNCAICNLDTGKCLICDNSYVISGGKCNKTCPVNQLTLDGMNCVPCSVKFAGNCTTCEYAGCLSCADGQLINGECLPCPEGTYSNINKCATCPSVCRSCTNSTTCQSCISLYYIDNNYCTATCPLNKVPNGTQCSFCLQSCAVCDLTNFLCSICTSGFYLYQSRCFTACPSPLMISLDSTKCVTQQVVYQQYSKQAKIVYFPFGIASILIVLVGIGIKRYSKKVRLITFLSAVLAVLETGSWCQFLHVEYLAWSNYHQDALKGVAFAIAAIGILIVLAMVHMNFYCKYIITDSQFIKWQAKHKYSNITLLSLASLINFKIYRLVHSRLFSLHQFSLFLSLDKLRPFSILSIASLILCSIPISIACSLALYFSITQDQQFFAAIDCLLVTGVMAVIILLDIKLQKTAISQGRVSNIRDQNIFKNKNNSNRVRKSKFRQFTRQDPNFNYRKSQSLVKIIFNLQNNSLSEFHQKQQINKIQNLPIVKRLFDQNQYTNKKNITQIQKQQIDQSFSNISFQNILPPSSRIQQTLSNQQNYRNQLLFKSFQSIKSSQQQRKFQQFVQEQQYERQRKLQESENNLKLDSKQQIIDNISDPALKLLTKQLQIQ